MLYSTYYMIGSSKVESTTYPTVAEALKHANKLYTEKIKKKYYEADEVEPDEDGKRIDKRTDLKPKKGKGDDDDDESPKKEKAKLEDLEKGYFNKYLIRFI